MTSYFPDLNVWLALSVPDHTHRAAAWNWLARLDVNEKFIFSRYTQLSFLRLLTNEPVMGAQVLTLKEAWETYDRWLEDPRVEFYPEPRGVDATFRKITAPFAKLPASKAIGDSWLLSFAIETQSTLVTFDRALTGHAKRLGHSALTPA
jgi:uncharacterized protein